MSVYCGKCGSRVGVIGSCRTCEAKRDRMSDRHREAPYSEGEVHSESRSCWCDPTITLDRNDRAIVQHRNQLPKASPASEAGD